MSRSLRVGRLVVTTLRTPGGASRLDPCLTVVRQLTDLGYRTLLIEERHYHGRALRLGRWSLAVGWLRWRRRPPASERWGS